MRAYGSGVPLVFDTSVFVRRDDASVRERWRETARAKLLAVCPVVALELLVSARDESEFAAHEETFAAVPTRAPVTDSVASAALGAARDLKGSRRLPAADYLIAAAAAERGFGVLHDDSHFDLLSTVLRFESVRVV